MSEGANAGKIITILMLVAAFGVWLYPQPVRRLPIVDRLFPEAQGNPAIPGPPNQDVKPMIDPDARGPREDLPPTQKRVEGMPDEQSLFFIDQKVARERGTSKEFAADKTKETTPSFTAWTCTVVVVYPERRRIRVLFDALDRLVQGDCFVSPAVDFSDFENLAKGTSLVLQSGKLTEIRDNGWLVVKECHLSIDSKTKRSR